MCRNVTFSPEVELTINYSGKRVQFSHGPIMGLIMGLSHLNCSKIRLKKIQYRRGLLGVDKVVCHLIKEWLNHIQNTQLPSLLQGIGPMNSIVIFCKYFFFLSFSSMPLRSPMIITKNRLFFALFHHSARCFRFVPFAISAIPT